MASEKKGGIWLETDLEPDDVFSILFLNKLGLSATYIVVGEGDANVKVARMKRYAALAGWHPTILRGKSSDKEFPDDGKEFEDLKVEKQEWDPKAYVAAFRSYVNSTVEPIVIVLKPPRELVETMDELKEELKKVTVLFYGGFNFRSVGPKAQSLLACFKQTYVYESFHATGHANTINRTTDPALAQAFAASTDPLAAPLLRLTRLWNDHIAAAARDSIGTLLPELARSTDARAVLRKYEKDEKRMERLYRNWKRYDSIRGHEVFQWVMADMCAVVAFFSFRHRAKPAKLSIDPLGYTKFISDPTSSLFYFTALARADLMKEMIGLVKSSFYVLTPSP